MLLYLQSTPSPLTPGESPINSSGYGFLDSGSLEIHRALRLTAADPMGFRVTERVLQAEGDFALPEKQRRTTRRRATCAGAPWVPARAAEASTPWRQRMDTGPTGCLVHPRLYLMNTRVAVATD